MITVHVTPDRQGWWTLSQYFSSLALTVEKLHFEDLEKKDQPVT